MEGGKQYGEVKECELKRYITRIDTGEQGKHKLKRVWSTGILPANDEEWTRGISCEVNPTSCILGIEHEHSRGPKRIADLLVPCMVTVPTACLPIDYGWFGNRVATGIVERWNWMCKMSILWVYEEGRICTWVGERIGDWKDVEERGCRWCPFIQESQGMVGWASTAYNACSVSLQNEM